MDALAALLNGPRAREAFLLRSILSPPWSLRIQDRAPLTVICPLRGQAWIVAEDAEPLHLAPGDVAVVRGPDPYTVADAPTTEPQIVIQPGQVSTTPDGVELCEVMDLGVRTWGDSPAGSTVLLTGTYEMDGEISGRLLAALPTRLTLAASSWDTPLIALLDQEIGKDQPGQQAVLDRLLDLLLITVLREWLGRAEGTAPAWYRAHSDAVVGPALRLMHEEPAQPWTVATLATRVGVSRAALARRFTDLVGEPPMTYLTDWRLALAADLLREPTATIAAVARRVGYSTPFALSAAFKRVRGVSPQQYRDRPA